MNNITNLSKLTFFSVNKYSHPYGYECNFSNMPHPQYGMGLILEGRGDFMFGDQTVTVGKGDIIFVPIGSTYISHWSGSNGVLFISVHFSFETNYLVTPK